MVEFFSSSSNNRMYFEPFPYWKTLKQTQFYNLKQALKITVISQKEIFLNAKEVMSPLIYNSIVYAAIYTVTLFMLKDLLSILKTDLFCIIHKI